MILDVQSWPYDEMPPTKKAKVTFTCSDETKSALEQWAEREGRTMSNLVERIVLAALEMDKTKQDTDK